jgi:ParB family chromosome partitioning protein
MTATIEVTADAAGDSGAPEAQAPGEPGQAAQSASRTMIATELLTAHPGNVRRDLKLDEEFLASIAEFGVRDALLITGDGAGGYRVIEGHRRLAAAGRLGIAEVPYDLDPGREGDEAGQYLDMYVTNHHRERLSTLEEADALFAASEKGASKTRIRKATGLGREEVAIALKAGSVSGLAREIAAGFGESLTLDQAALFAEFSDDDAAVTRIMNDICNGRSGQYIAEQIRQERAEAAERERLIAKLTADGYQIASEFPNSQLLIRYLLHDGEELTPEAHAACPGRAVYLNPYAPDVTHFCADPDANRHTRHPVVSPFPGPALTGHSGRDDAGDPGGADGADGQRGDAATSETQAVPAPDPTRKLVIDGNLAWVAAGNVRRRWLASELIPRRTAPRTAMAFITAQLLAMPDPVRDVIARASRSSMFAQITAGTIRHDQDTGTWPAARHTIALLAVIAACYEDRMDGDQGKYTWRTDRRFTQCPRDAAGAYLQFLVTAGHELSPIEQAVADGVPYTGDQPADFPEPDEPTEQPDASDGGENDDQHGVPAEQESPDTE